MNKKIKDWEEEFIEKGASLEHERWAGWQKYLHSLCTKNKDGSLTIPVERVVRWERQIKTSYRNLSEQEKEYDRIEVRKYLPFIRSLLSQARKEGIEEAIRTVERYPATIHTPVGGMSNIKWIEKEIVLSELKKKV